MTNLDIITRFLMNKGVDCEKIVWAENGEIIISCPGADFTFKFNGELKAASSRS